MNVNLTVVEGMTSEEAQCHVKEMDFVAIESAEGWNTLFMHEAVEKYGYNPVTINIHQSQRWFDMRWN